MNKDQICYGADKVVADHFGKLFMGCTSFIAHYGGRILGSAEGLNDPNLYGGALTLTMASLLGILTSRIASVNLGIWAQKMSAELNKECLDVESIRIEDLEGLEKLMNRTAKRESKEWGTFLRSKVEDRKDIVYEILDSKIAEERGLSKGGSIMHFMGDFKKARGEKYSGLHHYHPNQDGFFGYNGSINFCVSSIDRYNVMWSGNKVSFITFNMPDGPEIVGFNLKDTYIPKERGDPSELVKASLRDTLRYLKRRK